MNPLYRGTLAGCICLLVIIPLSAQDTETADPLKSRRKLGDSSELLLLWANGSESGERYQAFHDYLNLNNPDPDVPNDLIESDVQSVASAVRVEEDDALDVISGDFTGDGLDDYVAVWEGPNRSIEMIIPELDRTALTWTDPHFTTVADTGSILGDPENRRMLILSEGDFDDDAASEFVLSYWGPDRSLQMELYETDRSRSPRLLAGYSDPGISILPLNGPSTSRRSTVHYDVQTGDFDGDGTDEIVAVGGRDYECGFSQGCWKVFVRVYDVHPQTFQLVQRADTTIYTKEDNASVFMNGIAVAAGRYGPEFEEGIGVIFERSTNNNDTDWYLTMSRVMLKQDENGEPLDPALWATAADSSYFAIGADGTDRIHGTMGDRGFPINAASADFTKDGRDELVVYYRQLQVYEVDEDYRPVRLASFGTSSTEGQRGRHLLAVVDLDAEHDLTNGSSVWRPEIIVVSSETISDDGGISVDGILELRVYSWDPDVGFPSIRETELRTHRIDRSGPRPLGLAVLDAGDNGIRLGAPQRFAKTDIVRPLVVLNAPPTHFDVFDGEPFDINMCYGDSDCACRLSIARCFQAEYETETERSITMETELLTDWSVGVSADGGFDIPFGDELDIGVDIELKATYGEGFRRRDQTRQTFTVSQSVDATRDDWIYAMIVNYDIWEYPLLVGGEAVSNLAVVIPRLQTRAWFDSKSWNAFDYIPYHEVGNILSYRSIASPDQNSFLASAVRWDTGDQITLSGTSDLTWALTSEGSTETEIENSVSVGLEGSVDFDIPIPFIPDIGIEGDYSSETVNTQNISVRDTKGMTVSFGNVDQSIGNVRYSVIPYVYWAKNGALVLDYAVNPELAQPGFEGTWWQLRYGEKPDPAFILPWRLDQEKGADVTEAQTQQTREILFDPLEAEPGDVVTIKVRVHNWSLLPTPGPVEVTFFVGDPAAGGTPITGIDGEPSVFVEQLTDRGSGTAEMRWEVPADVGIYPRIYGVIDPVGELNEVHEDNNKGWNVLNVRTIATDAEVDAPVEVPARAEVFQNYPNPFRGATTIGFSLPDAEHVAIHVLDVLGREVSEVLDRRLDAGTYNVRFDASGLSSGVYLYRLKAGKTVETRQMMLVK